MALDQPHLPVAGFADISIFKQRGDGHEGRVLTVEWLLDFLVIDCSNIRRELGWTPPFTQQRQGRDGARVAGDGGMVSGERGSRLKMLLFCLCWGASIFL